MHVILVFTYCGWLSKEDVDDSNVLLIGIIVWVTNEAFNDLLAFCPLPWVVAPHWTLHSSHIIWKPALKEVAVPTLALILYPIKT